MADALLVAGGGVEESGSRHDATENTGAVVEMVDNDEVRDNPAESSDVN